MTESKHYTSSCRHSEYLCRTLLLRQDVYHVQVNRGGPQSLTAFGSAVKSSITTIRSLGLCLPSSQVQHPAAALNDCNATLHLLRCFQSIPFPLAHATVIRTRLIASSVRLRDCSIRQEKAILGRAPGGTATTVRRARASHMLLFPNHSRPA